MEGKRATRTKGTAVMERWKRWRGLGIRSVSKRPAGLKSGPIFSNLYARVFVPPTRSNSLLSSLNRVEDGSALVSPSVSKTSKSE